MTDIVMALGRVSFLVGALVILLAAAGSHRFSSELQRLHASAKASTTGIMLVMVGAAAAAGSLRRSALLLLAGTALAVTIPAAAHLLARSAHQRGPGEPRAMQADQAHDNQQDHR